MTILIPLGTGSRWHDNELRYCLRGIVQHLSGWSRIVIVGHRPAWLKENDQLQHYAADELPGSRYKELNIHYKIKLAINSGWVSGRFLFMNDDHFLLRDMIAPAFPYHHKGLLLQTLHLTSRYNGYYRSIQNTLKHCGNAVLNYDTHCPIVYDAAAYLKATDVDWPPFGFCIKSLYCHSRGIIGQQYPDCKLGVVKDEKLLQNTLQGRMYFSISDQAIGPTFSAFMTNHYKIPSPWE